MLKKLGFTLAGLACLVYGVFYFVDHYQIKQTKQEASNKMQIVVTNSILGDLVKNVGQNKVEVYSIVKPGVDPHEYEPKPQDITQVANADLVFYNGLKLETGGNGWFTKMVKASGKKFNQDVFAASKLAKVRYLHEGQPDPHAWMSLTNAQKYVTYIQQILSQKDPSNAKIYQKNAKAYQDKLAQLKQKAQQKIAQIPLQQRLLVTSEGAFEYFAQEYNLKTAYIWEINTEAQGTPEQMQQVLAKIRQAQPKSLFVESSVSPKAMQKVATETKIPIYAKLYSDSLGKPNSSANSYYAMMQYNLEKIIAGLAGN